jgi:small subunit ribosomal protein S17
MADKKNDETTEETQAAETSPATEEVSDTGAAATEASEPETVSETTPEPAPAAEETPAAEASPATEEVSDTEAAATDAPASEEVSDTEAAATDAPATEEVSDTVAPAKKRRSEKHVPRSARRTRTKLVREKPATRKPITRTEKPESELGRRQERRGVVVSDKGDKTIIVKVDVIKSHPKYKKVIRRTAKFHAHDEANTAGVGDTVRIVETRPLSKTKRWRLAEIVEKAR